MLYDEELENSIDYKYKKFYYRATYKLTVEEAKYILSNGYFNDELMLAARRVLIEHIESLEARIKKLELQTIPLMQGELSVYRGMDKIAEEICREE